MKLKSMLFASFLALASNANAQELTVVHGIDGTDLGQAQALPVDVSANGTCLLKGVSFKAISAASKLSAGVYNLEVRLSDGKCGGALAATGRIDLGLTENAVVIAHLSEQGTPVLTKFTNDLRDTDKKLARVIIRHAASAPSVTIQLQRANVKKSKNAGMTFLGPIESGSQTSIEANARNYSASIKATATGKTVADANIEVAADKIVAVYAVGSVKRNTFTLISQALN